MILLYHYLYVHEHIVINPGPKYLYIINNSEDLNTNLHTYKRHHYLLLHFVEQFNFRYTDNPDPFHCWFQFRIWEKSLSWFHTGCVGDNSYLIGIFGRTINTCHKKSGIWTIWSIWVIYLSPLCIIFTWWLTTIVIIFLIFKLLKY